MFRSVLAFLVLLASPVTAENRLPATGEILSGWREADGRHVAGLVIRLAPGWKTYWRAPGEGGIPPRFNWSGSKNLANVDVRFPVPKVIDQAGLRSYGYDQDVVFPLIVTARQGDAPVDLFGEIEIGVCEEICVPLALKVRAKLPAGGTHDGTIAAALKNKPKHGGHLTCEITPITDGLRVRATTPLPNGGPYIAIIETGDPRIWVSPPDMGRRGGNLTAEVDMVPPTAKPFALARNDVRMTLLSNGGAIEMVGCR